MESSRIECNNGIKQSIKWTFRCINRDENAVNNMIKIVESQIKNNCRPERFTRGYKIT